MNVLFAMLIAITQTIMLALNQYYHMYLPYKEGKVSKKLLILTTIVTAAITLFIFWSVYVNCSNSNGY